MELDSTVPPSNTSDSGSCTCHGQHQADDPYVADMLKVADDSIALLCRQVHDLTNEKQGAEGKVKSLRKQVCSVFCSCALWNFDYNGQPTELINRVVPLCNSGLVSSTN